MDVLNVEGHYFVIENEVKMENKEPKFKFQDEIIITNGTSKGVLGKVRLISKNMVTGEIQYLVDITNLTGTNTNLHEWYKENEIEYDIKKPTEEKNDNL